MKISIVPIGIIAALTVFLNVQTVQGGSFALDWEPASVTMPETDSADGEDMTTDEAEQMEESNPAIRTISAGNGYNRMTPAAVPVVTPEEAEQANREALAFYASPSKTEKDRKVIAINTPKQKPIAIAVLSPDEAKKANKEAISYYRNKALKAFFLESYNRIRHSNIIHLFISLIPFLLIADVLFFRKKRKPGNEKAAQRFSLSRRTTVLLSVSLFCFGLLVFVPWSVYFGNSLQFPFIFQDFVNWNLRVLTMTILGTTLVLLFIPAKISDYIVSIIAGLGLCVYVQAMFMNQHLGTMDGIEPVWSEHRIFGTINLIIWAAIVLSPVFLRRLAPSYFPKAISIATGIVLVLEVLATASMVFSASQDVWSRPKDMYYVDGSKQFQLSKDKNVVFFMMDNLASGYLEQCFEEYPETKEIVKDFIWYADARSNYHLTFPGMIHELTGAFLPAPANNYYDLFEKMWHSPSAQSFYRQVKEAGYDARLFFSVGKSTIGPEEYFHDYFSNIEPRDITFIIDYKRIHFCLRQMSCFSSAPYFFKRYFFYAFDFSDNIVLKQVRDIPSNKQWIPKSNSDYLRKMLSSGITTDANKPVFSFHYTFGVHHPWNHDEKCNVRAVNFDNPVPTTRGCLYILSEFIRLLKDANIYDNTAIFVCSDHGGNTIKGSNGKYDMSFMLKPFHNNATELSIDETKVQSIDILPTLLYLACGENVDFKDFEGFSPNNIPKERVRKVYRFFHNKNLPPVDPDLDSCYPGVQGLEEYIFNDIKTFELGTESESFVRQIPLISTDKEDNS